MRHSRHLVLGVEDEQPCREVPEGDDRGVLGPGARSQVDSGVRGTEAGANIAELGQVRLTLARKIMIMTLAMTTMIVRLTLANTIMIVRLTLARTIMIMTNVRLTLARTIMIMTSARSIIKNNDKFFNNNNDNDKCFPVQVQTTFFTQVRPGAG